MPLDGTGPAPRSLSEWVQHLKRNRLAAKQARQAKKRRREISERRIIAADDLFAEIINRSDMIGRGTLHQDYGTEDTFFILVSLPAYQFRKLCEYGAELEDLEENGDHEADIIDEPSLGSADGQPNQTGWAHGAGDDDREDDRENEGDDWALPVPDGETPYTGAA